MKKNMGVADRVIRMIAAIILMDLSLDGVIAGIWRSFSWVVVTDLELTGLLAWCPLYAILHIHTDVRKKTINS
ncbi:MAG: hypothetical protein BGO55_26230 [Sphingobacteriales bacterium 50-39]|nr:DUF2892 domain-containing protein [Sphingobacteriales bacterium]OJW56394.1 MAG: hypothetical protein BGO55_26230 [Sphingobacteriales bacterium 50-39]